MLDDIYEAIAAFIEDLEFYQVFIIAAVLVAALIGCGGAVLEMLSDAKAAIEPLDELFS